MGGGVSPEAEAFRVALNRAFLKHGLHPLQRADFAPSPWELRLYREPHRWFHPEYDPETGDIISYRRESGLYYEVRDREGRILRQGEGPILESEVQLGDILAVAQLAAVPARLLTKAAIEAARRLLRLAATASTRAAIRRIAAKEVAEWTVADYQLISRALSQKLAQREARVAGERGVEAIKELGEQILPVEGRWRSAAETAARSYRKLRSTLGSGPDAELQAGRLAGTEFHALVKAAPRGPDIATADAFIEVKTHFVPFLDAMVASRGREQVLAYVLRDLVELGTLRRGIVRHVFIDTRVNVKQRAVSLVIDATEPAILEALRPLARLIGP